MATTGKAHAVCLQVRQDAETVVQAIAFPDGSMFRRTLTEGRRTRWSYGKVFALAEWLNGYMALVRGSAEGADPEVVGPVLMEVADDEYDQAKAGKLDRNVGLRFDRVRKDLEPDATSV